MFKLILLAILVLANANAQDDYADKYEKAFKEVQRLRSKIATLELKNSYLRQQSQKQSQTAQNGSCSNHAKTLDEIEYSIIALGQSLQNVRQCLTGSIEPTVDVQPIKGVRQENHDPTCVRVHTSCAGLGTGIYEISLPVVSQPPLLMACNGDIADGNWTVILRRSEGKENFYRNWQDYRDGFGSLADDFWLGLDTIHAMTAYAPQELLVVIYDSKNVRKIAKYDNFVIGGETENYGRIYRHGWRFLTQRCGTNVFNL